MFNSLFSMLNKCTFGFEVLTNSIIRNGYTENKLFESNIVICKSYWTRLFRTQATLLSEKKFAQKEGLYVRKDGTVHKRNTKPSTKITLFYEGKEEIWTFDKAKSLAEHKGYNLVKCETRKHPLMDSYRLVSDSQLLNEKLKKDSSTEDFRTFIISSKIGKNDLLVKIKKTIKHINKNEDVKILVKRVGNDNLSQFVDSMVKLYESNSIKVAVLNKSNDSAILTIKGLNGMSVQNVAENTDDGVNKENLSLKNSKR